ncbi:MAG: FprA family A-type flavoprotein [Alphaproteobacteria bacterium]
MIEIKENIYAVGVKDWDIKEFHGYSTPKGATYNSYLIMGEKIVLIDGVKKKFSDEHIKNISEIVDPSKIDYVIVNHVEQDHSGNVPEIMKLAKNAKIITNGAAKMALEAHFDTTGWEYEIIKSTETFKAGDKTFAFLCTPLLHWPDSMMTYLAEDKVLFSNDGFGQHFCSEKTYVSEEKLEDVLYEAKKYYANILYLYANQAKTALKNAGDLGLDIEMIASSHGLIWRGKEEVSTILNLYSKWASGQDEGKALVVFDSMWGATETLANTIADELKANNVKTQMFNLSEYHISEIIPEFLDAKYICIGNPTLNNELFPRVAQFVTYMKGLKPLNKKGLAFGSYGWKPGVVKQLQEIFEGLGWETVSPFEEKYTPKTADLESLKQRVQELIK